MSSEPFDPRTPADTQPDPEEWIEDYIARIVAERDALALELRRLRAAEAPGTDDEAFAGTGWIWRPAGWCHDDLDGWVCQAPYRVLANGEPIPWFIVFAAAQSVPADFPLALDAMRAAVRGSV